MSDRIAVAGLSVEKTLYDVIAVCNEFEWVEPVPTEIVRDEAIAF